MAFLPTATASYAISVRQASVLPSAFFRFHLAMDTLAVRLIVPLIGSIVDFHHQVIRPPPRVSKQRQLRHYAPYLAHHKKAPIKGLSGLFQITLDFNLVPRAGLEPARLSPPPPQDGVSTNSTTWAKIIA
jgi:hypothetical protein